MIARIKATCLAALTLVIASHPVPVSPGAQTTGGAIFTDYSANRPGEINLLTYNVAALPWPIANRTDALNAIAARLKTLRSTGAAPQIVVVQEAFTDEAQAIGRAAGYRYQAIGPGPDDARPKVALAADFVRDRTWYRAEKSDPTLDSGLAIFSDFPILATRSVPFAACAGIDCAANKGVLIATIKVPGLPEPIEVATTHLNSRAASLTSPERNLYAYRAQLDAIDTALAASGGKHVRLFAGDFNVHSPDRLAALQAHSRRWKVQPATAMGMVRMPASYCGVPGETSCGYELPIASNLPLGDATDWQFFAGNRTTDIRPLRRVQLFGRDTNGAMLSDHIGYSVVYRLSERRV
ncbi:endonuclease/exonuclease/phosphatase family protein [Sphingomonas montanisoli]|uniref:Endonuclease/exonuclease/phosphatase n=1 Tax=Sphingomonas montanisoli TaxID=2606412 RepID=A0A5D9CB72_9SPHN|nr:endonuclease/exonuclease/phosphatase family protein [Sphingomonas montanisoli]TZG29208.1 endonuclease/exonuclease/phosphatase [Sphingomonas montanisoli]